MLNLNPGLRVRPAALAAALLLCASAPRAQTALETVSVTAARGSQRVDQALAEVTVLDRADLEAHAGLTLAEVLATQPGIQFWSNGGRGKNATVSMRGLEARHTLLLIDGVRYGSATLGTPVWDNLPLDAIERIEIVRGPMSALYGSDAVGGVIQIFTRKGGGDGLKAHGRLALGSHGLREGAAGLRLGAGAFDAALGVQAQQDDGFSATNAKAQFGNHNPDRDGFKQRAVNGRVGFKLGGDWRIDATVLDSRGENQFDDGPAASARAALHTQVLALQAGGTVMGAWQTQLRVARTMDEFDTQVSASPWASLGVIGTTQKQIAWENSLQTGIGRLLLLAERLEQDVERPGTPFAQSSRRINAYAVGLNGEADAHHWQIALRRDNNSQFGGKTTGSAAYALDFNKQVRAGVAAASSFVAPSFNQLYFPGFGNPKLLPEEGRHSEFFVRWMDGPHRLRAAWFINRIRGYISSGPLPTNIPRIRSEGLSLSYELNLDRWAFTAALDAIDPRNDSQGNANLGKLLPRRAKDHLRLGLERQFGAWSVGAALRHAGDRFEDAANTRLLRAHTLVDLRADWRMAPDWALGLKLNNVANIAYETAYGFNQPGREWQLTLRWGR